MIRTERARLTLGNAALQDIADQLNKNEAELTTGAANLGRSLTALTSVTQTLATLSGVLNVVPAHCRPPVN